MKNFKNNDERTKYLDEQLEEIQETQEEELLIDFDKAIEELEEKPYHIKFINKIYEVPRKMPFEFATFFFRYCYKKVKGKVMIDVPDDKLYQFIQLMFGNEMITALETNSKRCINVDMVFDKLALKILDKWGYGVQKRQNKQEKKI